jgi:putative ABC transport system permease protein
VLKLAFRNLIRNLRRLRPMIIVLGLSFFLLFTANAILEFIDGTFSGTYVDNLTGHLSVSANSEESFTLFGAESLLVGEYLVPPVIDEYENLTAALDGSADVADYTSLVTSAARLEIGGRRANQILFGVDFDDYRAFFPELELTAGRFPATGEAGILIQDSLYRSLLAGSDGQVIGEPVLLTTAYETSFTIREVVIAGAYRYPVEDDLLSRIALVDADTARSLNGFVYGAADQADLGEAEQGLLDTSLDDLFADPFSDAEEAPAAGDPGAEGAAATGSLFDSIDSLFAEPAEDDAPAGAAPLSNAWNFLLIRTPEGTSLSAGAAVVRTAIADNPAYLVRDWRRTIGGTVLLVWFIRIVLNIGIAFVIFGASAVTLNAIVLSVLERAKEIGTMRAVGATKGKVALLFSLEIMMIISGTALLGILGGIGAAALINSSQLVIDNQYIYLLFGGNPIRASVSSTLVTAHVLAAFALAALALIYPMRKVLNMSPVRAMGQG